MLYLREVNKFLALVCILREDNFDHKGTFPFFHVNCKLSLRFSGIIDYNFLCFRNAIQQVFELRNKAQNTTMTTISSGSPMVNGNSIVGEGHLP